MLVHLVVHAVAVSENLHRLPCLLLGVAEDHPHLLRALLAQPRGLLGEAEVLPVARILGGGVRWDRAHSRREREPLECCVFTPEGAVHVALEVVEFVDVQPALDVVHDLIEEVLLRRTPLPIRCLGAHDGFFDENEVGLRERKRGGLPRGFPRERDVDLVLLQKIPEHAHGVVLVAPAVELLLHWVGFWERLRQPLEERLELVGEGPVPKVVHESCDLDAEDVDVVDPEIRLRLLDLSRHLGRLVRDAQRVLEARVRR
mmetsp:Transcript_29424/g.68525  ORF Transcript_29424/g.68525 Transcript_29424/m.68525 type:complete len:258 (-) Transcript_29424:240-1013(-)